MQTVEVTVPLHTAQDQFCRSDSLYRGFVGGRGAGKSWVGAFDLICRAREGRTYLVGSPTGVLMQDTTFPTFKALAERLGVWWGVKLTPYPNVTIAPGATIRFRSAEDPQKMRGPNLSGCWLDEASLMDEEAYKVCIGSLREQGQQGWLSATFTPKGRLHWTYGTFATGRPNTAIFRSRTGENPFLPPAFEATLANEYVGLRARQELGGEFVAVEGAEWPPEFFERADFWFDDWPDNLPLRVMGLDPSMGKASKHHDDQALIRWGRSNDGIEYVEADMRRYNVADLCELVVDRYLDFHPEGVGVETNAFQELLLIPLQQAAARRGANIRWFQIPNTVPKNVRILRLTQPLATGKVRFKRNSPGTTLLVEQLRSWPEADHDDGPDGWEMTRRLAIDLWNRGARR